MNTSESINELATALSRFRGLNTSDDISELAQALSKFQGEMTSITKDGESHHGKYIMLDSIIEAIRQPLVNNGLSYVQMPTIFFDSPGLTTRLMHKSGEWIEDTMPVFDTPNQNRAQAFGGGLTYARRYALTAMLGIAADEDTDGNGDNPPQRKQQSRRPAKRKTAPPSTAVGPPKPQPDRRAETSPQEQAQRGRPGQNKNGNIDWRAKIEAMENIQVGSLCSMVANAHQHYQHQRHAENATDHESGEWLNQADGLKLFDELMARGDEKLEVS